jgi:serine/threonine-protein kinase
METTVSYPTPTPGNVGGPRSGAAALLAGYREIADADELGWDTHYRKRRLLGTGGQGAVYLADRLGADGFIRPVALKVFSPESYGDRRQYQEDMARVGKVASRVARIQHDHVVDYLGQPG